jgi:hypothetical protein
LCGPKGMPCIPFTRAAEHGFFLLKCEMIIISQSTSSFPFYLSPVSLFLK